MKHILIAAMPLLSLLLLAAAASALSVEVGVAEKLEGSLKTIQTSNSNGLIKVVSEFYNSGSIGYTARERLELNATGHGQTAWSSLAALVPGQRGTFEAYLYSNTTEDAEIIPRVYFANEILAADPIVVRGGTLMSREPAFELYDFRAYDDMVRLDIRSSKDVGGIVLIPEGYPPGWVFEQARISSHMKAGRDAEARMGYHPDIFSEGAQLKIMAVSEDGRYYGEGAFVMRREAGLSMYINLFIDGMKNFFRSAA
ncbi:MAG: hypothetical protein HY367_02685 [Candidatus Aenigmarchaeota archaeon]|nr:hypothetical protein [Candidatus Aenigmarchaeota archaeon]